MTSKSFIVTLLIKLCQKTKTYIIFSNLVKIEKMSVNLEESDLEFTPPEIKEAAKEISLALLPEKSRKRYENFIQWQETNKTKSYSEDTVLVYFKQVSKKYKSSSLWTQYSMLRATLNIKHDINIESYPRLRVLLKRHSAGYQPKKAEVFSGTEIDKFIEEAPDSKFLATKVALIMGVMGACRSNELHAMKVQHLKFFDGLVQVKVPETETKVPRNFVITGKFFDIVKKYVNLRPVNVEIDSFFLNFKNGKYTKQVIGINKFGNMGKQIATFLNIQNPERYTGHCLRRSSATLYADAGASMTNLKRHGAWKSPSVVEGYIADSKKNKIETATKILDEITNNKTFENNNNISVINNRVVGVAPPVNHFTNCTVTINYYNK